MSKLPSGMPSNTATVLNRWFRDNRVTLILVYPLCVVTVNFWVLLPRYNRFMYNELCMSELQFTQRERERERERELEKLRCAIMSPCKRITHRIGSCVLSARRSEHFEEITAVCHDSMGHEFLH